MARVLSCHLIKKKKKRGTGQNPYVTENIVALYFTNCNIAMTFFCLLDLDLKSCA